MDGAGIVLNAVKFENGASSHIIHVQQVCEHCQDVII